jgi:predicted phosphodiesterase
MVRRAIERVLALPDVHAPYQNERALKVVEKFARDFKPTMVLALGDWLDAKNVATFAADPEHLDCMDEFQSCVNIIERLKPTHFFQGNHEQRYDRPLCVPYMFRRLLDPRHWLELDKRGIKWIPYSVHKKDVFKVGDLTFVHGFSTGVYACRNHAMAYGNVVFGHTHHFTQMQIPDLNRPIAYNIGCLCDLSPDYISTKLGAYQWQHGFGFGYIYKSGGHSFYPVRIGQDATRIHINGKVKAIISLFKPEDGGRVKLLLKPVIRRGQIGVKRNTSLYKSWLDVHEVHALIMVLTRAINYMEEYEEGTLDLDQILTEDEDGRIFLNKEKPSIDNMFDHGKKSD